MGSTISEHEAEQVERANAAGRTPVVFVHGLWLLPTSWDNWAELFIESGYTPVLPGLAGRPGDRRGGEGAPGGVRRQVLGDVAAHYEAIITQLDPSPPSLAIPSGG